MRDAALDVLLAVWREVDAGVPRESKVESCRMLNGCTEFQVRHAGRWYRLNMEPVE